MVSKTFVFSFIFLLCFSLVNAVSRDEAVSSLEDSKKIMERMQREGFSVSYVNDSIYQANIVLQQADYAEILRNVSSSNSDKVVAKNMLRLVDWKNITYESVLIYTSSIAQREKTAYELFDLINSFNLRILSLNSSEDYSEAFFILQKANESFMSERYTEAEGLLVEVENKIDEISAQNSVINVAIENTKNFFARYWLQIVLFFVILFLVFLVLYKKINKRVIRNKIYKTKAELRVLKDLKIQNQTERFKENKISALVYNIREKNYNSRIARLTELLPVLEKKLRK
jgi:hypothetical protein